MNIHEFRQRRLLEERIRKLVERELRSGWCMSCDSDYTGSQDDMVRFIRILVDDIQSGELTWKELQATQ